MSYLYRCILGWGVLILVGVLSAGYSKTTVSPPVQQEILNNSADGAMRYTLPTGTALQILLQTPIDTTFNQPGDPVEGIMSQNLYLGGRLLLSKNTRLTGLISRLDPPFKGRDAILGIRFTQILPENNTHLPITAHVRTGQPGSIWGGMLTQGTKPMLSTQRVMGIGEYNRVVYGGPRAMGSQIQFAPGEPWTIILEQPLVLVRPLED